MRQLAFLALELNPRGWWEGGKCAAALMRLAAESIWHFDWFNSQQSTTLSEEVVVMESSVGRGCC